MIHTLKSLVVLQLAPLAALRAIDTQLTDSILVLRKWAIGSVQREAAVYILKSAPAQALPLIFAFAGARCTMCSASKALPFDVLWPDSMVVFVYMQSLNSPRFGVSKKDGKPIIAWQHDVSDDQGSDLRFFDAVLATLRKDYPIDARHIYSFGHSNGGVFTYLLWQARGETFAAVASCASQLRTRSCLHLENPTPGITSLLSPKPMMQIAGRKDPIAPFEAQSAMVDFVREFNGCDEKQSPWGHDMDVEFPSTTGDPVITWFNSGAHELPKVAMPPIIKFFKEHAKP